MAKPRFLTITDVGDVLNVSPRQVRSLLASGDLARAEGLFDELYSLLPGEAPPKLALAYCRARRGDHAGAADLY